MAYDAQQVAIEREKLLLERTRIRGEERRTVWTSISVVVSLLAALGTVIFGVWSIKEQAKIQFRTEALKSIMAAPSETERMDTAEQLQQMFPHEMEGFAPTIKDRPDAHVLAEQRALFNALAQKQDLKAPEVLALWLAIFPDMDWVKRPEIKAAIKPQSSN